MTTKRGAATTPASSLWQSLWRRVRREPSRDELQAMWDEGEPVEIADFIIYRHSSLCALNATGHCGPCSCGGVRG